MENPWEALPGVVALGVGMLSLAWTKRKQDRGKTGEKPTALERPEPELPPSRKSQEFKRDYDPIEPS